MSTKYPALFEALAAEFGRDEVRSRAGQGGQQLWYITSRMAMNRLDSVLGPENWDFSLSPWGENALIGTLTIRLPDGTAVSKSDVGGRAQMKTADDDTKSASSDCFKRCAVLFGISRYLYQEGFVDFRARDGTEGEVTPADVPSKGERLSKWAKEKGLEGQARALAQANFKRDLGDLGDDDAQSVYRLLKAMDARPVARIPERPPGPGTREATNRPGTNPNGSNKSFRWPSTGAALFAWAKDLEESFRVPLAQASVSLIKAVDRTFVDGKGWDRSWKTWDAAQVEEGAMHVAIIVSQLEGYGGQFAGKIPDPKGLQDTIWKRAADLLVALGATPTTEAIEEKIHRMSQSICARFGGEVITDLVTCQNAALLEGVLEAIEGDLVDAKETFA